MLLKGTSSLVYAIGTDDNYKDFFQDKHLFNFSYYPQESNFFDLFNKKINGKMKDEFKGKTISEFLGLESEMYFVVDGDGEENKKENKPIKKYR